VQVLAPLVSPMTRGKISFVSKADQAQGLLRRVDAQHLEASIIPYKIASGWFEYI
jgi:hypothetical protein